MTAAIVSAAPIPTIPTPFPPTAIPLREPANHSTGAAKRLRVAPAPASPAASSQQPAHCSTAVWLAAALHDVLPDAWARAQPCVVAAVGKTQRRRAACAASALDNLCAVRLTNPGAVLELDWTRKAICDAAWSHRRQPPSSPPRAATATACMSKVRSIHLHCPEDSSPLVAVDRRPLPAIIFAVTRMRSKSVTRPLSRLPPRVHVTLQAVASSSCIGEFTKRRAALPLMVWTITAACFAALRSRLRDTKR